MVFKIHGLPFISIIGNSSELLIIEKTIIALRRVDSRTLNGIHCMEVVDGEKGGLQHEDKYETFDKADKALYVIDTVGFAGMRMWK